jgi:hypothetical protein|nr:MAG TPA: hypothetical protein [Bacteriophage sp.]
MLTSLAQVQANVSEKISTLQVVFKPFRFSEKLAPVPYNTF